MSIILFIVDHLQILVAIQVLFSLFYFEDTSNCSIFDVVPFLRKDVAISFEALCA